MTELAKTLLGDTGPYSIEHDEFALDGILELDVFGREQGRTYRVQWDGWTMAMVEHWDDDNNVSTTADLPPDEVAALERWIRRSDRVEELFADYCADMRNDVD